MKAVIVQEPGRAALNEIPEQKMRDDYIKVKTVAVTVNPTDFHHTGGAGLVGGILGLDFSGIVEEVGRECESKVQKGDKVYGVCHCANLNNAEDGAFAEYAMVKDGHIAKIPANLSFESAATLGTGLTSVGQSLYMVLNLPLPTSPAKIPFPILISGGSSATGTLAIQYAKLSGLTVITTASPKNFELVKSRGADAVFDYNDPLCAQKIKEYTNNKLRYVLDTICTPSTFKICAEALPAESETDEELNLVTLLPLDSWPRKDVKTKVILAYTSFGEAFTKFGQDFPVLEAHYRFGCMFWELNAKLVAEGRVVPHPMEVRSGGLAGIPAGITEVYEGLVSGFKLVYRVGETPEVGEVVGVSEGKALKGPELKNW